MKKARNLSLSIYWQIIRKDRKLIIFGFISLIIALLLGLLINKGIEKSKKGYEKYDNELIEKNGKIYTAVVVYSNPNYSIEINGEHPTVIQYVYEKEGYRIFDETCILNEKFSENLDYGSEIKIKVLENQSKIAYQDIYTFPFGIIAYIVILPFIVLGLILIILAYTKNLKDIKLYKYGTIQDGVIVSNFPMNHSYFNKNYCITYYFFDETGKKRIYNYVTNEFKHAIMQKDAEIKILVSEDKINSCMLFSNIIVS